MSLRTGSGALKSKPSKAKLREMGRRGNTTQQRNAAERRSRSEFGDGIPF